MMCQYRRAFGVDIADKPGLYGILEHCGPGERVERDSHIGQIALHCRHQHLPTLAFVSRTGKPESISDILGPDMAENMSHRPDCAHSHRSIGGTDAHKTELCFGVIGGILQRLKPLRYILPLRLGYRAGACQKLGHLRRLSTGIGQPIRCCRKLRGLAGDALQPLAQPLIALAVFLDQTGDAAGAVEAETVDGGPLYLMQAEHFHAHISRLHGLLQDREPVLLFARSDATNLDCVRPLARLEGEADIEIIGATRGVAAVNLDCSDGALLAQIELEPVGHCARIGEALALTQRCMHVVGRWIYPL